jgi:hypothetical protein
LLDKLRQPQKFLQRRFIHLEHLREAHMVIHQRQNLLGLVVRKAQPPANFGSHPHANVNMPVESNTIRRNAKRRRFPHIVQ